MSRISTSGSSISASGVSCTRPMPQRLATSAALAGVREAIATTGKPASAIGREMHVGHDEAGADAADPEVAAADLGVGREAQGVRSSCLPVAASTLVATA